eukprot:scaffold80092_cov72-Phaeocystis_antarctica.AAC.1
MSSVEATRVPKASASSSSSPPSGVACCSRRASAPSTKSSATKAMPHPQRNAGEPVGHSAFRIARRVRRIVTQLGQDGHKEEWQRCGRQEVQAIAEHISKRDRRKHDGADEPTLEVDGVDHVGGGACRHHHDNFDCPLFFWLLLTLLQLRQALYAWRAHWHRPRPRCFRCFYAANCSSLTLGSLT